jgi:hypothetical protein
MSHRNKKSDHYLAQRISKDIFSIADQQGTNRFDGLTQQIERDLDKIENPTTGNPWEEAGVGRQMGDVGENPWHDDDLDLETGKIAL